jgi:hypothetical protein
MMKKVEEIDGTDDKVYIVHVKNGAIMTCSELEK